MSQYVQGIALDIDALRAALSNDGPQVAQRMRQPTHRYSKSLLEEDGVQGALDQIATGRVLEDVPGDVYGLATMVLAIEYGTFVDTPEVPSSHAMHITGFFDLERDLSGDGWPIVIPTASYVLAATYDAARCRQTFQEFREFSSGPPELPKWPEHNDPAAAEHAAWLWLTEATKTKRGLVLVSM